MLFQHATSFIKISNKSITTRDVLLIKTYFLISCYLGLSALLKPLVYLSSRVSVEWNSLNIYKLLLLPSVRESLIFALHQIIDFWQKKTSVNRFFVSVFSTYLPFHLESEHGNYSSNYIAFFSAYWKSQQANSKEKRRAGNDLCCKYKLWVLGEFFLRWKQICVFFDVVRGRSKQTFVLL